MPSSMFLLSGKTEAVPVVAVIGQVVVPVGGTNVPGVVDPTAAAQNTVVACYNRHPQMCGGGVLFSSSCLHALL